MRFLPDSNIRLEKEKSTIPGLGSAGRRVVTLTTCPGITFQGESEGL